MSLRSPDTIRILPLLASLLPAFAVAETLPAGVGKLVVAGGGVTSSAEEMWDVLFEGRLEGRPIGIISTASADPPSAGLPLVESLIRDRGQGCAVFLPLSESNGLAEDSGTLALIRRCGGFYFTGGQQDRTVHALRNPDGSRTSALEAIWEIYLSGGIIGGTSAGAAIMSDPMITGGTSADALLWGATPPGTEAKERGVGYGPGLGFHPGVLYCQHHLERGRFGRLLTALTSDSLDIHRGVGVAEDTAWVVDHEKGTGTVIGAKGVVYLDSSGAKAHEDGGFGGVRLHYLEAGDTFHSSDGRVVPGPGKVSDMDMWAGGAPLFSEPFKAWSPDAVRRVVIALAQSGEPGVAVARDERFDLRFRRTETTRVWGKTGETGGSDAGWTVRDILVRVAPRGNLTEPVEPEEDFSGALPEGKGRARIATRGKELEVFTYRPESYEEGPLLVVLHGLNRNADDYRDNAVPMGDRFGALVAAPKFSLEDFPVEAYQRGGVTLEGEPRPMEEWTFQYIEDVVAAIREREGRPDLPYYLIGHSAGGQFLNRLSAFLPGGAVRIVSSNPGSLLFPTRDLPFQFGFGNLPGHWSDDAWIRQYLAAPLTLYLGTEDLESTNLDLSEEAMRQGGTRFERGHACFAMAEALAREKGWPFHWTLVEAEGVGHSSARMFAHEKAEEALFGRSRSDSADGISPLP